MVTTAMTVLPCVPRGCSTHDHSGDGQAARSGASRGYSSGLFPLSSARLGAHIEPATDAATSAMPRTDRWLEPCDRLGAGADGAWRLRRTATRSPWRTVMIETATVSPGGTSRGARVQAREVSIPGRSPADAGAIRRMLRR